MDNLLDDLNIKVQKIFAVFINLSAVNQTITMILITSIVFWISPRLMTKSELSVGPGSKTIQPLQTALYGMVHANIPHFITNATSLYYFGHVVLNGLGTEVFLWLFIAGSVVTGFIAPLIDRWGERRSVVGASCGVSSVINGAAFLGHQRPIFSFGKFALTPLDTLYFAIGVSFLFHFTIKDHIYHLGHGLGFLVGLGIVQLFV